MQFLHFMLKIGRLGGGATDFAAFIQHVGVPSVDMFFGGGTDPFFFSSLFFSSSLFFKLMRRKHHHLSSKCKKRFQNGRLLEVSISITFSKLLHCPVLLLNMTTDLFQSGHAKCPTRFDLVLSQMLW